MLFGKTVMSTPFMGQVLFFIKQVQQGKRFARGIYFPPVLPLRTLYFGFQPRYAATK
jgi:hypothetical protein